ncbi:MAG: ABC transporter ATP-binding protein, partial [Candidatus Omnitrophota bacterium]
GNIRLFGKDITSLELKEFCRQVAFVSQDALSNFSFSVFEIVLMGRIPHLKRLQPETKKDLRIAELALTMTDTLHLKDKMINELSSGERQRVLIARALAQEPVLIFLDEPTAHLDIGHQVQILDLLRKLNRNENLTIVMVLHDLNLAGEYCNRLVLLDDGRVFKEGVTEQVLTYQNIEKVYKTLVVVNKNPINSKPYVLLVSGEK